MAILEPVHLQGSTISRATLNNLDYILKHNLQIGSLVTVEKGGEVIPKISGVQTTKKGSSSIADNLIKRDAKGNFLCPCSLNSVLWKEEGKVDYYCVQEGCTERHLQSLLHFVSKDAMNIEGMGESTIKQLLENKLITNLEDIYLLKGKRNELLSLPGWKALKTDKLLRSIEASKHSGLARLIYALGIPHVGSFLSLQLAETHVNLENLKNQSLEKLIHMYGLVIGESIYTFFHDSTNLKLLEHLKNEGLKLDYVSPSSSAINITPTENMKKFFEGRKVVISGSFEKFTQDQLQTLIRQSGGKISSSVSKNTNVLVVGSNPGSKLLKAQKLKIEILTESSFHNLMDQQK